MILRIAEAADAEAFDAAIWYESRRSGLGDEFLEAYKTALAEIRRDPNRLPLLESDPSSQRFRRIVLKRFPYGVIFEMVNDEVHVHAVAHLHRRPDYWLERIDPQQ